MNLDQIAALLGQLQTILSVLDQLPPECRKTVMGTLKANGLDVRQMGRSAVKAKHSVQAIPKDNFEPLVAMSPGHLPVSVRDAFDSGAFDSWGCPIYANEYGAFMAVVEAVPVADSAPKAIRDTYNWAAERGIQWIKFDADASYVSGLPCYGDGETEVAEEDVVLSA